MSLNPDQQILRHLFAAAPDAIPAAVLSRHTGLDEKELHKHIDELCSVGYGIERLPHQGYVLRHSGDVLIADEIQARLPVHPLTQHVQVFHETRSTNDLAHRNAQDGHPGPLLIIAESQTHGRGRQGRVWSSKPLLGLWFSLLLRPAIPVQQSQRLTIQACVALHRAIQKTCQIRAEIKWPNDLLYKGKKLAGILTEARIEGSRLSYAIVGIGCNINHRMEDFPSGLQAIATSLSLATGHPVRRCDLVLAFLEAFEKTGLEDWDNIREEWKDHCLNMGRSITLQVRGESLPGQMIDIDEDGSLIFRHASGTLQTIHTGEILT